MSLILGVEELVIERPNGSCIVQSDVRYGKSPVPDTVSACQVWSSSSEIVDTRSDELCSAILVKLKSKALSALSYRVGWFLRLRAAICRDRVWTMCNSNDDGQSTGQLEISRVVAIVTIEISPLVTTESLRMRG